MTTQGTSGDNNFKQRKSKVRHKWFENQRNKELKTGKKINQSLYGSRTRRHASNTKILFKEMLQ